MPSQLFKYADDTNLLVPDTDVSLSVEYDRCKQWANLNHLVNHNKLHTQVSFFSK